MKLVTRRSVMAGSAASWRQSPLWQFVPAMPPRVSNTTPANSNRPCETSMAAKWKCSGSSPGAAWSRASWSLQMAERRRDRLPTASGFISARTS